MKVTIDNQDGNGSINYTQALYLGPHSEPPVEIVRRLNEPTLARLYIDSSNHGLTIPAAYARVDISSENGAFLFTGYLPFAPEPAYAGRTSLGPHYRYIATAVSEDWLLDRTALPQAGPLLGEAAGKMVRTITNRVNPSLVEMNGLEDVGTIGFFEPAPSKTWSENVAALASQARAAYRILNGELALAPIGSTVRDLTDTRGQIVYRGLNPHETRQLANDVTIAGLSEPTEYVTELLRGDGATVSFQLQREPMPVSGSTLLDEEFATEAINPSIWNINDAGGYLKVSGAGLTLTGGAGTDGTTTLTAIDPIELGGEVVIEAGFVQLSGGSDGVLCGLYSGSVEIPNCVAGFRVRTSGSNTILVPIVNGNEIGTSFTLEDNHTYIVRIRAHSQELLRINNSYFSYGVNGPAVYGGGSIASPLNLLFELQDMALLPYLNIGSTILYDGALSASPAIASFACVNSSHLVGSVGYFRVERPGTIWVVSTPAQGSAFTRRVGAADQGADCNVAGDGSLHFYPLATPQPGETLAVTYRVAAPSVARLAISDVQGGGAGLPAISQWIGHLERPAARSSIDCENACRAVLDFSANPSAGWKGGYRDYNLQDQQDVWPGDALDFTSPDKGFNGKAVVRMVRIASTSAFPEVLNYEVEFANDWADSISLQLTDGVSPDVVLPAHPQIQPENYLPNLNALQVNSISETSIMVSANAPPPVNGGFEVRSRDYTFGPAVHEDLILRSPTGTFTIARAADREQFFIRMYDGSNPPRYSRTSSAVFTNVPIA